MMRIGALLMLLLMAPAIFAQNKPAAENDDPVLQAMRTEMERSKVKLKLEQMAAPYYIDYRITESENIVAEAAFGALRGDIHTHIRFLRVTVRIGDYKQDS